MMPGGFVPAYAVRMRKTIFACTTVHNGHVNHKWVTCAVSYKATEGVLWVAGWHAPDCAALEAWRAADALR